MAQDYPNFEIVVADDCSTDDTQGLLREYDAKYPGKFVLRFAESNKGISANFNLACKACSGEWIKPIAGDDSLKEGCLTINLSYVLSNSYEICFSGLEVCNAEGKPLWLELPDQKFCNLDSKSQYRGLIVSNKLRAPGSFIKKSLLKKVGYADERFAMLEDYPLWLAVSKSGIPIRCVNEVTVIYRMAESIQRCSPKIANLSYLGSVYLFQKELIWPYYPWFLMPKKYDEWLGIKFKLFWINYFGNEATLTYKMRPLHEKSLKKAK